MEAFLNELAGVISLGSYSLYIVSTLQGKTKPSRSTWWILTLIGTLIFSSSSMANAGESNWIQISYIAGPLAIALLSIKYGYGDKRLLAVDKTCIAGTLFCFAVWIIFNSAIVAFMMGLAIDFMALLPTIKKSAEDGESEDIQAWLIEILASLVNFIGIACSTDATGPGWIYASYLLAVNSTVAFLLVKNLRIKARRIPVKLF